MHVPVKVSVEDIRTAKERVEQNEKFVSVAFTMSDALAVCTTFEANGRAMHPYLLRAVKFWHTVGSSFWDIPNAALSGTI